MWINQEQDFCILSPMSKTLQTFIYTTNSFLIVDMCAYIFEWHIYLSWV